MFISREISRRSKIALPASALDAAVALLADTSRPLYLHGGQFSHLLAMHLAGGTALPRGPLRIALFAAWGFAAWTLMSMLWAQSPALAWEGANRTILFAALASLALLSPAPARQLAFVGHALVAGIALLAVVTLLRMRANGPDLFLAGRLDSPVVSGGADFGAAHFLGLRFTMVLPIAIDNCADFLPKLTLNGRSVQDEQEIRLRLRS